MVSRNTKECLTEKKFNNLTLVLKAVVARVTFTSNFLITVREFNNLPEKPDSSTSVFSSDYE